MASARGPDGPVLCGGCTSATVAAAPRSAVAPTTAAVRRLLDGPYFTFLPALAVDFPDAVRPGRFDVRRAIILGPSAE